MATSRYNEVKYTSVTKQPLDTKPYTMQCFIGEQHVQA